MKYAIDRQPIAQEQKRSIKFTLVLLFIVFGRISETRSQWERCDTDGILIHCHSLGPPHVLKTVILSNLLVLHRRFDFLESYLTAVLAPGLPSQGKKKKKKKSNGAPICNSYTLGEMFNSMAVIQLSSLIKEKMLPFYSLHSRHLFDELSSGVIESVN